MSSDIFYSTYTTFDNIAIFVNKAYPSHASLHSQIRRPRLIGPCNWGSWWPPSSLWSFPSRFQSRRDRLVDSQPVQWFRRAPRLARRSAERRQILGSWLGRGSGPRTTRFGRSLLKRLQVKSAELFDEKSLHLNGTCHCQLNARNVYCGGTVRIARRYLLGRLCLWGQILTLCFPLAEWGSWPKKLDLTATEEFY